MQVITTFLYANGAKQRPFAPTYISLNRSSPRVWRGISPTRATSRGRRISLPASARARLRRWIDDGPLRVRVASTQRSCLASPPVFASPLLLFLSLSTRMQPPTFPLLPLASPNLLLSKTSSPSHNFLLAASPQRPSALSPSRVDVDEWPPPTGTTAAC